MKTVLFAALLATTGATVSFAGPAFQTGSDLYALPNATSPALSWRGMSAEGRCGGVSYGTGARRCSDGTGGPVGGPGMRN